MENETVVVKCGFCSKRKTLCYAIWVVSVLSILVIGGFSLSHHYAQEDIINKLTYPEEMYLGGFNHLQYSLEYCGINLDLDKLIKFHIKDLAVVGADKYNKDYYLLKYKNKDDLPKIIGALSKIQNKLLAMLERKDVDIFLSTRIHSWSDNSSNDEERQKAYFAGEDTEFKPREKDLRSSFTRLSNFLDENKDHRALRKNEEIFFNISSINFDKLDELKTLTDLLRAMVKEGVISIKDIDGPFGIVCKYNILDGIELSVWSYSTPEKNKEAVNRIIQVFSK